ncbi:MAG: SAM-dependent methyltransferase [Chloroflexi bacterium]|nr:SAM-dependent methyltransferase [Chloroflexota bacterium]
MKITSGSVEDSIRALIAQHGKISFATFMASALYESGVGYYSDPKRVSESGDFFTSPAAHPAFGVLLTLQLHQMWVMLGNPDPFNVMELGPGSGLLGDDIVSFSRALDPNFASALDYQRLDRASLEFGVVQSGSGETTHCILSNELLDAFPVNIFQIENGVVREKFVSVAEDRLVFQLGEVSDPEMSARIEPYLNQLPEGYESEVCLGLSNWAEQISRMITSGYVISIDYGYTRDALYSPQRSRGTLLCHYRHTVATDPLIRIGEQDISAHVDFTAVDEAMAAAGLEPMANLDQGELLQLLGIESYLDRLMEDGLPQRDIQANQYALRALTDPDGLGRFRVAVHGKNVLDHEIPAISGDKVASFDGVVLPALDDDPRRVNLFAGAYGGGEEISGTWEELLGG